jgi:hypothetical protein
MSRSADLVKVARSHVLLTNYVTIVDANKSNSSMTRLALVFSLSACAVSRRDPRPLQRNSYWCIGWCGGSCRFRRASGRGRKRRVGNTPPARNERVLLSRFESLLSLSFSGDTQDEPRAPPRKKTKVTPGHLFRRINPARLGHPRYVRLLIDSCLSLVPRFALPSIQQLQTWRQLLVCPGQQTVLQRHPVN